MGTRTVPVTPAVVAWAIEEDGRSAQELADAVGVDVEVLRGWAEGESAPSIGQTSDLAKALGRPRSLFLLPEPPRSAGLPPAFRHPPGSDGADPPAEVLKVMRRARRVQHAAAWALRQEAAVELPLATLASAPEQAAEAAAEWLGSEPKFPDAWAAWRARRGAIEERDVLVFNLSLGRNSVRGFSAWDERAPLIVVNSTGNTPQVRSFTLMHELGHLLLRADAACVPTEGGQVPDADVERWCESFAAALMMPDDVVEDVAARASVGGPVGIPAVRAVARAFWVSHRAAALRLIELRLAERSLYAVADALFRPGESGAGGSGERRHETRLREYGERPLQLVLGALQPRDALSVLRLQVEDVRTLAAELPTLRTAL
jgi:Zn-dependent peptidase ImmA (M78 family)